MEIVDKEWNKEELKKPIGQPSSCVAQELALCVAADDSSHEGGKPSLCNREGKRSSYETREHTLCVAGEHPCGTEDHSLYETGENTLCAAGEHSVCLAAEHLSCGTGELPSYGKGEHVLCVTGECEIGELPSCGTGEHRQEQGHLHEPNHIVPLCGRIALLVFCIVALNIGIFFVTMYINDCPNTSHSCFLPFLHRFSFQPLHENMLIGPSSQTLERLGALHAIKVQHFHQGWRLITCIWLHAGVVHVLVNMISLLFVGIQLEQEFGAVKVGTIYVLSGFGGSLLSVLFLQNVSVGASGALFGLVGAMLSELLTNWTIYTNKCAVMTVLIFVVTANLAIGIFPFVDNFAHIGGLIVGFLSGFVLLIKPQYGYIKPASLPPGNSIQSSIKAKYRAYQCLLWVIALILLIAGIAGVAVLVFQGVDGNNKCSWCHYLSCVPTSKWDCHNSIACDKVQVDNEWQITCTTNHKTTLAPLNQSNAVLQELCIQLCS